MVDDFWDSLANKADKDDAMPAEITRCTAGVYRIYGASHTDMCVLGTGNGDYILPVGAYVVAVSPHLWQSAVRDKVVIEKCCFCGGWTVVGTPATSKFVPACEGCVRNALKLGIGLVGQDNVNHLMFWVPAAEAESLMATVEVLESFKEKNI